MLKNAIGKLSKEESYTKLKTCKCSLLINESTAAENMGMVVIYFDSDIGEVQYKFNHFTV